eukprot:comp21990_c1_seq1/m.31792 comp21990_c1_seq1/g.31792  ORF comp21990_c1_seq1/g.31792 comp21990_c1_seq1/m.31792 type:complete len:473 (-) comp21990_c1_seq1:231-1649(-)
MVLCSPFPAESKESMGEGRKTVERNGTTFDQAGFRITSPVSWALVSRLKGALAKDKYRIHYKSGDQDLVLAYADSFDDILVDWKAVCEHIIPELARDSRAAQQLPQIVDEMLKRGVGNRAYRKQSTTVDMQMQRERFEHKIHTLGTLQSPRPARSENRLAQYEVYRTLGTGSFGRVMLVKEKATGRYCALKIIKKEIVIKLKQVEHTANEKNILACIEHPFVINMVDYFQDKKSLYFCLEYINGGEMFTHIHRNRFFSYEIARHFAAQTVLAFEYLHNLDIVYRDLKPENLLIDRHGNVRVTDFGFAKRVTDKTWTLCGTPEYLAPEIILSKGYNHAVDWWALGVLIYEMRSGHAPFVDANQMEMYRKIVEGRLAFPNHFKQDEREMIAGFLSIDLTRRLGNMKKGVADIKGHRYFKGMDFDALMALKLPSPYVPRVGSDGDDSNFDRYDEEKIEWAGDDVRDPYEEIFKNF